jgi:hypothetical protein
MNLTAFIDKLSSVFLVDDTNIYRREAAFLQESVAKT